MTGMTDQKTTSDGKCRANQRPREGVSGGSTRKRSRSDASTDSVRPANACLKPRPNSLNQAREITLAAMAEKISVLALKDDITQFLKEFRYPIEKFLAGRGVTEGGGVRGVLDLLDAVSLADLGTLNPDELASIGAWAHKAMIALREFHAKPPESTGEYEAWDKRAHEISSPLYINHVAVVRQGRNIRNAAEGERINRLAKDTLEMAERAATGKGITAELEHFKAEAEADRKLASYWLTTLAISGAFIMALGCWAYHCPAAGAWSDAMTIQRVAAKLLIISIPTFIFVFAAKNYRAAMHNRTMNRHRANAFKVSGAFLTSVGDDKAARVSILRQAAKAVFQASTTGYLKKDNVVGDNVPLVEVVRAAAGK